MKIKLQMKISLCLLILLVAMLCLFVYGCDNDDNDKETFTAQFIIDDQTFYAKEYNYKDKIPMIEPDEREGFTFKGWYMDEDKTIKWDFDNDIITADTKFYGYYVLSEEETFNILYYVDETLIQSDKVLKNDKAEVFTPQPKRGYEFAGWFTGETKFNFDTPITDDVTLTAKFEAIIYHVKFIADNNLVSEEEYTVENLSVYEPQVPVKDYYEGVWNNYELDLTDVEVKAKYTPIVYKAEYIIDNEIYKTVEFSADEKLTSPPVPQRAGFNGEWIGSAELGKNTQITANYTPITYEITYMIDGETVKIIPYTVLDKNITPPALPPKPGYSCSWQNKPIELGNITIEAEYIPITYYATFVADGKTIATEPFTVENLNIAQPTVPTNDKAGYVAKWEPFTPGLEDITVNLIYEPIIYNANFYVDGALLNTVKFTVEDKSISLPEIPNRDGYSSTWQQFEIQPQDISVNAVYKPITYYVTFVSYESEISIPYTVENKQINEPEPTMRKNYNVKWEDYELTIGNITVNAIYTPIFKDEFDYRENQDGTLTVSGYHGSETEIIIPAEHNDKKVKAIGNQVFQTSNFTTVELCYGIEEIEQDAFLLCEKLTNLILPTSLKKIGSAAFAFSGLKAVDIPDSVTEIGEQAFAYTPLKTAKVSDNMSELKNIFYNCTQLESIDLGSGIEIIKSEAFENCNSLKKIFIPANIKLIESNVFFNNAIEEIEFEDTENWYITLDEGLTDPQLVPHERLADSTAACQFVIAHSTYYWHKKSA